MVSLIIEENFHVWELEIFWSRFSKDLLWVELEFIRFSA